MSEKKLRRQTNLWALNKSNPDDPLLKCLLKDSQATNTMHSDGSTNKSREIEDLAAEALQIRFQKRGDMEGLGLLQEHYRRRAVKVALETNQPLPAETLIPQPIPQTSTTSPSTQSSDPVLTPAPAQLTLAPKPPEKKRRIEGSYVIGSSGHMKRTGE